MPLFAKIFQQAKNTFSLANKEHFSANILKLKGLIDFLELKHLKIEKGVVIDHDQNKIKAPCTFINICEQETFTMSVFIIRQDFTMPLHDHPRMKGVLKCVSGKLRIQSYTRISPSGFDDATNPTILVTPDEPKILDCKAMASYLDENKSNFHEITALDGPAAFFDVLSPPYSDFSDDSHESRHCHFYKSLMVDNSERKTIKLERIECPESYYCESLKYEQPSYMKV